MHLYLRGLLARRRRH